MKKVMKVLLIVVAFMMLTFMVAMTANAETATGECGIDGDNLTWTLDTVSGELEISGVGKMKDFSSSNPAPWIDFEAELLSVKISEGVTNIGSYAFYGCSKLKIVTMPNTVLKIGSWAFYGNDGLESIAVPDSVATLGESAFQGCTNLKNVIIGNSVKSIGGFTFAYCYNLLNIKLGDSITNIGSHAFLQCEKLEKIEIPDGVTSIGFRAFYVCESITSVTMSDSVKSIGESAFHGCKSVTSIDLSASLTVINNKVFSGCEKLENIIIPDSVTSIGDSSFYGCSSLKNINIPEQVESIGGWAFCNCDSFTSLTLPKSIKNIGEYAFYSCGNLSTITLHDSVKEIGEEAFSGCKIEKTYYNGNIASWVDINFEHCSSNPCDFDSELYFDGVLLTDIIIPDGVKEIKAHAFCNRNKVNSISISDSVEFIGYHAFGNCALVESIKIPDSVTVIENSAFSNCRSVKSVVIPDSVTSIGEYALSNCTMLEEVVVGSSIKNISKKLFDYCYNLKKITIPKSVTTIDEGAFHNCFNLDEVFYAGTEVEWNRINIKTDNDVLNETNIYYNHPNGHIYTEQITKEPTHTEEGETTFTCICGDAYTEAIEKLEEHTYISKVTKEPTHLEEGVLTYACECGDTYTEVIPKVDYQAGDIIQFGSYPQSKITDSAIITALNNKAPAWDNWTSYGYYTGMGPNNHGTMEQGDWMRYTDVIYNGYKYRGVKFTQYRPYYTYYQSSLSNTYQDNNGYSTDIAYWFKFEPITWRVLDPTTGLVMCETLIDSQPYSNTFYKNSSISDSSYAYFNDSLYKNYACDYETSSIRQWLNNDFYNTAFTDGEKKEINTTTLNNDGYYTSIGTTGYESFDSNSTNDKIFLLSYNEVRNSDFGFNSNASAYNEARFAWGSDYAKIQGVEVIGNSGSSYDNTSMWLLRSPGDKSHHCCYINNAGYAYNHFSTYNSQHGIRPALCFNDIKNYNHQHTYTSEITTPATHLTEGVETYTCACGDTYTEPLAKLEGHTYTSEVTKEPTHLEDGIRTYTCECTDSYTETINKLSEHTYKAVTTKPTCTAKGYTTYVCECNDSYVSNYIGAKGHSYSSIVTTPATHIKEGVLTYTCSDCGDSYTDKIDKTTEHTYNKKFVAPSCTETGYTVYTCACGDTYISDYISETGHNDNNNDGTCDGCGIKLSSTDNENCSCNCHKSGLMGIIWKILRFFYKLFKINPVCGCGVSHY